MINRVAIMAYAGMGGAGCLGALAIKITPLMLNSVLTVLTGTGFSIFAGNAKTR